MKIWKVFKSNHNILAYVKVPVNCEIFDTSYASLQLVRKIHNDSTINGTQLVTENEQLIENIPIYTLYIH